MIERRHIFNEEILQDIQTKKNKLDKIRSNKTIQNGMKKEQKDIIRQNATHCNVKEFITKMSYTCQKPKELSVFSREESILHEQKDKMTSNYCLGVI